ncbi:uncharacterized protein LOC130137628 [Syzygium oleosum]|uniref:uncharacterized protein LOC130137628 n=1 Tax=Syzygium oleosum TaxID=219896 RepID=UPI0024BAB9FF|nr:uncharacterized protein LOC130137628 [Syzygium oleosum]
MMPKSMNSSKKFMKPSKGSCPLSQYYSELRSLWHELDFYDDFHPTNPLDAAAFRKRVDKFRVFEFLAGLNMEYDQIRAQILCRVPFPTLEQSYAVIHLEEKRRSAMHQPVVPERSALYTIAGSESRSRSGNDKQIVKCDYCGKERHTRETCYKLHGRPSNAGRGRGRGRTGPQVHLSEAPGQQPAAPSDSLSAAELTSLRLLLARNVDNPGTSTSSALGTLTSNFAQSGLGNGSGDWSW